MRWPRSPEFSHPWYVNCCCWLLRCSWKFCAWLCGTLLKLALHLLILPLVCASGCGTRVILVPPGDPVQLRATVERAAVWVFDAQGQRVPAVADLPAGWFCMPDEGGSPPRRP